MPEKRFLSTCILLLLCFLLKADPAWAQQRSFVLRGELSADSPSFRASDYQVQLMSNEHIPSDRAHVSADGSFTLMGANPGIAQVRVVDQQGEIVYDEYLTVQDGVALSIRMRAPEQSRPATGKISARELAHPVPEKALKEYARAKKAATDGDFHKTFEHFHKALEIDPNFFQAWNDLGVAHIKQRNLPEAAEAFQKAADIAPENQVVQTNLKVTRLYMQQVQMRTAAQP